MTELVAPGELVELVDQFLQIHPDASREDAEFYIVAALVQMDELYGGAINA